MMVEIYATARQVLVWLMPTPISDAAHQRNLRACSWLFEFAQAADVVCSSETEKTALYAALIESAPTQGRIIIGYRDGSFRLDPNLYCRYRRLSSGNPMVETPMDRTRSGVCETIDLDVRSF